MMDWPKDWKPQCFAEGYQGVGDETCCNCPIMSDCSTDYDKKNYPHNKDCEGTMCYCANRAKKADPERYARFERGEKWW